MDIELIVLDIDGCIKPSDRKRTKLEGIRFLQEYCASVRDDNNPPVSLLTGRPSPYCESVVQDIDAFGSEFSVGSVCENGAVFWNHNESKVDRFHPEVSEKIEDMHQVENIISDLCEDTGATKEQGKEICISINPESMDVKSLHKEVQNRVKDNGIEDIVNVAYSATAVDVTPKGVNKATGLDLLTSSHGISMSSVLGVGDSNGDLEWLREIGYPATPSNGAESLKAIEDVFVADEEDSIGTKEIIKYHI